MLFITVYKTTKMNKIISLLYLLFVYFFIPSTSFSQIRILNMHDDSVKVSLLVLGDISKDEKKYVKGWWTISPNEFMEILDVTSEYSEYYIYAMTKDLKYNWTGENTIFIHRNDFYEEQFYNLMNVHNCPYEDVTAGHFDKIEPDSLGVYNIPILTEESRQSQIEAIQKKNRKIAGAKFLKSLDAYNELMQSYLNIKNAKLIDCNRCGGEGWLGGMIHVEGDQCHKCKGTGKMLEN